MFRKSLNVLVAVAVAISGFVGPASAQTYMFRYKTPVAASIPDVPDPDVDFGIGNDIVAYYVAPIGYSFSKKIPVATQDVVEWRKDSGEVPGGIGIDPAKGILSGEPAAEEQVESLFLGYDRSGNRIARAKIHFTTFEPVGEPVTVDFYAHTDTYFYGEIPNPKDTSVARWEPIVPFAQGLSMMGQALQGTPEAAGTWGVAWRGYDYLDREVAFAYGDLLVETGPVVEEIADAEIRRTFADQIADKSAGGTFSIQATVQKALGPVTYRLVPVDTRPPGLTFSSQTGTLSGVFDDFETSAQFQIEARDSYDGTTGLSNVFSLETLPQTVNLANLYNLYGYAGKTYYKKFTTPALVATAEWAVVSGTLPEGLVLDAKTGVISGTPVKMETQTGIVIGVSGAGMTSAQSSPFVFTVYPEYVSRETKPLHVRTNTPFQTQGVKVSGISQNYTVSADKPLIGDLSINPQTGVLSSTAGLPTAGYYDLKLIVDNGNKLGAWQSLRVYNPLEVSYSNAEIKRNTWFSVYPTTNSQSTIGSDVYTITDVDGDPLPSWMTFSPDSGRIYGAPRDISTIDVVYGPYIVKRTDAQDSKDSEPFTIKVVDRDQVDLQITDNDAQRYASNGYRIANAKNAVGSVTYSVVSYPSNWPSTLRVHSSGWLIGTTTDPIGTVYQGLVINAVDGEGYDDTSDPIDLTVIEPKALSPLYGSLNRSVEWTADMAYSGSLPKLSNSFGTVAYAFVDAPAGLTMTDPVTGSYSFNFAAPGTYVINYTIDDDTDRVPAQGTLTVKVNPGLALAADATYSLNRAALFSSTVPVVTGGTKPYTYVQSGTRPAGLFFSNGNFYGTPTVEGQFPVSVQVTDKAGQAATRNFTLDVRAPLDIEVEYADDALTVGKFAVVWPQVKNAIGTLKYQLQAPVDDNGQAIMPPGITFDAYGRFIGTPLESGVYAGYKVKVTDSDTPVRSGETDALTIIVTRSGPVEFADVNQTVRKGANFTTTLAATNVVSPVGYSLAGAAALPAGVIMNGATGVLSGSFADVGTSSVAVTAKDRLDREATSTVTYTIVDDLTATATDVTLKQHEASTLPSSVTTTNTLGAPAFTLSSGSLPAGLSIDPANGAIVGTSDDAGVWPISIDVADTDGQKQTVSFTVTVDQRLPLAVEAPAALSLKRFAAASFAATTTDAIPPVQYDVTPDLPVGITLDSTTGAISGSSDDVVAETVYTLMAVDSKGGALGTDTTQFTLAIEERDALRTSMPNVAGKLYSDLGAITPVSTNAIGTVTYTLSPTLPSGLVFDPTTGVITGTPETVLSVQQFTLTATDSKGGALGTATANFTLTVADRAALEFVTDGAQTVLLAEPYSLALAVKNVVGNTVTWTEVSGTLPDGLTFDAVSGTISGTATTYDERTTFTVKAADDFGGEVTTSFVFAVGIAAGDLTITASGGTTRVDEAFAITSPTTSDTIGTVTWSLSAGSTGLSIDPATGEISGTPSTVFDTDVAITVKDITGRRGATTIRVTSLPRIDLSVTASIAASFNYDIIDQQAVATQVVGTEVWSISGPALPNGLSLDTATGAILGKPLETGAFGPYTLTVADDLPGTTSKIFSITATMNDDPIELSVTDFMTKIGYPVQTAVPAYGNNLGPVTFFSTDLGGTGLTIDPITGVLTGTAHELADRSINISVRDRDTTRVTSRPLRYQVIPTMKINLPSQVIISALTDITPVAPTRNNVIGTAVWDVLDQSVNKLPDGIVWDEATGTLRGNATEIGTFGPFTVSSIDSLGDRGVSNSFVVKSNPGAFFLGLAAAAMPAATKRIEPYSFDFSPLLTTVGMDLSEVTWSAASLPPGLSLSNGVLSGTPSLSGTFNFTVTASYGTISATRGYTLVVGLPQTKLELAGANLGEAKRAITGQDKSFTADLNPQTTVENIPLDRVTYTLESFQPISQTETESFPTGLTLNPDGSISGTASSSGGVYQFRVKANFKDATDEDYSSIATYTLTVKDEIKFTFGDSGFTTAYKRLAYTFDLGTLLDPSETEGVTASQLAWSWSIDTINAVAPNMTTMPTGLSMSGSTVSGTPSGSGTYALVVTASFDGRSISKAFTLQSKLQTIDLTLAGTLPDGEYQKVYSADLKTRATVTNIPLNQVKWTWNGNVTLGNGETAGLPTGLTLSSGGVLSGTAGKAGKFRFEAVADWTDTNPTVETLQAKQIFLVDIKGVAPTISVTTDPLGYVAGSTASINLTIGNAKTGDVVTLAPGSAALPPGLTIAPNGTTYRLSKASVANSNTGVYRGIKLRVTDVDGLFGETVPFAIVYASNPRLTYPAIAFNSRANQTVDVAPGTPTGIPSADVRFAITTPGAGGSNLTIAPATGRIGGFITSNGTATVTFTESYDGIFIRSGTYSVTYTVDPLALSLENMVAIEGQAYSSRLPKVTNSRSPATFSITGGTGDFTVSTSTGRLSATPSVAGTYAMDLTYTDNYGSITKPVSVRVVDGNSGHRYWRVEGQKSSNYRGDVWELKLNAGGFVANAAGALTTSIAGAFDDDEETSGLLSETKAVVATFDFKKKVPVDNLVATVSTGFKTTVTLTVSWSDDGINWTSAGTASGGVGAGTVVTLQKALTN